MRICIYIIILMLTYGRVYSQKINFGTYISKKGSILKLKNDNTFFHEKQQIFHSDIELIDRISWSTGSFKINNNHIIFKSYVNDKLNDSIKVKGIKRNIKTGDSLVIKLSTGNDNIKIFICETGLERKYNRDDYGGCFLLKEGVNKVPIFIAENFHFRIYPNIESVYFRNNYSKINTLFFETKKYQKEIYSDLEIEINFDLDNFLQYDFDEEIALIKGNIIRFLGEDFIKQK
jgi:hypothetical protein